MGSAASREWSNGGSVGLVGDSGVVCVGDDSCGSCVAVTVCGIVAMVGGAGAIADDDEDDCCVVGSRGAVFVLGDDREYHWVWT